MLPAELKTASPTRADVELLAHRMRADDRRECEATGYPDALTALQRSMDVSSYCRAAFARDGELLAIFGVTPMSMLSGRGVVWALTSDAVETHKADFVAVVEQEVPKILDLYPVLCNAIDARYQRAVKWARRVGFTVFPALPRGVRGEPFCPILLTKEGFAHVRRAGHRGNH